VSSKLLEKRQAEMRDVWLAIENPQSDKPCTLRTTHPAHSSTMHRNGNRQSSRSRMEAQR